jgi:hypothetical protein
LPLSGYGNLNYRFNQGNRSIKYFNCSNNNSGWGKCPTTHYIRLDFLEQVVLQEFQRLTEFSSRYEDDFVRAVIGHSMKTVEAGRVLKQKELDGLLVRDRELDTLFTRIYEDKVCQGILSNSLKFGEMAQNKPPERYIVRAVCFVLLVA